MAKEDIISYLFKHSPFSLNTCEEIANKIDGTERLSYIHEVLLGYLGGEDNYAYETAWELAEGIKKL